MSLLIDVEMGRPIEAEVSDRVIDGVHQLTLQQVIVGAVVRIAQEHNIPTPLLSYTYALLKALQGRILHQREMQSGS